MNDAQVVLWSGAGCALGVAVLAGWRERARKRRHDLNAVGLADWPTVQVLALLALAGFAALALHVQ